MNHRIYAFDIFHLPTARFECNHSVYSLLFSVRGFHLCSWYESDLLNNISTESNTAGMAEWSNAPDCKSGLVRVRGFESLSLQIAAQPRIKRGHPSSVGRAAVL